MRVCNGRVALGRLPVFVGAACPSGSQHNRIQPAASDFRPPDGFPAGLLAPRTVPAAITAAIASAQVVLRSENEVAFG